LFACSLSVLALDSVRGAILVAQLANIAGLDSSSSESADKSPDAANDSRVPALAKGSARHAEQA
jgi:hypothetical protein